MLRRSFPLIVVLALLRGRAVAAETLRIGPEFRLSSSTVRFQSATAALAGGSILALWPEGEYGVSGRLMAALTDGGSTGEPRVLRSTIFQVQYPAAASSGTRTFVAWYELEQRELAFHLLGMILDAEGQPLTDPLPIFTEGLFLRRPEEPAAVVWTGKVFAVVSTNEVGRLLIRRYTEAGVALDPAATPVTNVVREDPPGNVALQLSPSAASSGSGALLVWQDGGPFVGCFSVCTPPPPPAQINAVRLDVDGLVIDPVPLRISPRLYSLRPTVASNEGRFLVAWSEQGPIPEDDSQSLNFTLFDGLVAVSQPGELVPLSSRYLEDAVVAPFRQGFAVAWSDARRAARYEPLDIYATTIDRDGTVSSVEYAVSAGSGTHSNCSLLVSHGRLIAVYERGPYDAFDTGVRQSFARSLAALAPRSRGARR